MFYLFNPCLYKRKTTICALTTFIFSKPYSSLNNPEQSEMCGRVIDIQAEEKRTEEEVQPKKKPFRFFIAQGRLKNRKVPGVSVTLKKDHETLISVSSILHPGDVITELSGASTSVGNTKEIGNNIIKTKNIYLTIMCISDQKHN
ncbi:uncharacterized protein LOC143233076 [Tachypleus tridentatus]|uniref:uncharacterized protein LOC143233076 n=1 Tax=Tachypleus tridentatus TaxID=6853 RepID=UPI003FD5BEE7